MIRDQILTKDSFIHEVPGSGKESFRLLVPIDFSQDSYNALEYAMQLTKMCGGGIELIHVIDTNQVPNSESPLNMKHALAAIESQAYRKLNSLCEILRDTGIVTFENIVRFGSHRASVEHHIKKASPDLVVVGQETRIGKFLSSHRAIARSVLTVPPSIKLSMPFKILLVRDNKSIDEKSLKPLLTLVRNGLNRLTILHSEPNIIRRKFNYKLPIGEAGIDTTRYQVIRSRKNETRRIIMKYAPDLICEIVRPSSLIGQLWDFLSGKTKIVRYDIPTLRIPVGT